jgi:hypothetical protein
MKRRKCRRVGTEIAWCFASAIFLFADSEGAAELDPVGRETVEDAQCVVVGARLSASSNQTQNQAGAMLLVYFLGRIDGRSPHVDLEGLVAREARHMTTSDYTNWAHRCGEEFSARGGQITQIGKSLQLSGK